MYDPASIYLMGHSCGAHMLSSILLDSSGVTPSLTPPPHVLSAVKGVILSAGIYVIDELLERFPSYRLMFIEDAFGKREVYSPFSVTNLPARSTSIRWLIAHSANDELVDLGQSGKMFDHLRQLYASVAQPETLVTRNVGNYGDHDDMLNADEYLGVVAAFVQGGATM